jgi:hypothetical protein
LNPSLVISIAIFFSFLAGWFYVIAATIHPLKIFKTTLVYSLFLFLSILNFVFSIFYGYWILILALNFLFFVLGYLIKSKLFLSTKEEINLPVINTENLNFKEHTAIIYFTHGEPEIYDPIGWLNQFREFDEQKVKFVPFVARTFFIHSLRKKYLIAGKSNHRAEHFRMMRAVEKLVEVEGRIKTRFYMAFLDDRPCVEEAVIKAINEGAKQIIISNVFLTVSSHTACGYHMINSLDCEKKYGVKVIFTEPLWNSEYLKQAFVEKVNEHIGEANKSNVAIALIGYGQPDEWDKTFPTQTEQEIIFREKIIEKFVEDGYKPENLGMAWMDFKKPNIIDLLNNFNYKNIEKIYYFAAAISADSLISQVLIPEKIEKYPFPKHVQTINMGAWDEHSLVIQAIKEKIDNVLIEINPY